MFRINPLIDDGFNVRLDGGVEIDRLLADLHGVKETAERFGHVKVVVIGRDFADVIIDVVTPPLRLTGGLVLGKGAIRHGFAEPVESGHPDDGQRDDGWYAAHRPLEQKLLNRVANPARDEPTHHVVQCKETKDAKPNDNIEVPLVAPCFADEECHRQHRRADQE